MGVVFHRASSMVCALLAVLMIQTGAGAQHYEEGFRAKLVAAVLERTKHRVTYDGSYRKIGYPGGDVPDDRGVCTDLIIRSYRGGGLDLQREVHQDMSAFIQQTISPA